MPEVRLACARVGDKYIKPLRPDTLVMRCDHCAHPVYINPETIKSAQGRTYEICCLECNHKNPCPVMVRCREPGVDHI